MSPAGKIEAEIRMSGFHMKSWSIKCANWDHVWWNLFHMLLKWRNIRWVSAVAVHGCMSAWTATYSAEEPFTAVPFSKSWNRISFLKSMIDVLCMWVCVGYLYQRTRGRGWGWARMEMFGGCRRHGGWVDCWVMSHWSLLQSLLSNPNTPSNTQAGRSTGIWACGWKSWVGRTHTLCIHMENRAHTLLLASLTRVRILPQRMWPLQQRLLL